jgi:tripartite-type tricarboxylate transporter receptor subunit TctC
MRLPRRKFLQLAAGAAALPALSRIARAQAYPSRPIKVIVPFPAGGNVDFVARLVVEEMSRGLGQPFVVDYRAGAGGSLGAEQAARSAADGYTLLAGSNGPLTVNPFVQAKLGYDPIKDFVAIGLVNLTPQVLAVHPSVPARNLQELVALSKAKQLNIGTSGAGSATHMTLARLSAQTKADFQHVPYRGAAPAVTDLLAGSITGVMTEINSALPHHQSGKARIIAVASATRSPQAPEVATMIEAGLKDFTAASYVGILALAGTPLDVVATLEQALIKAMRDKSLQDKFLAVGADSVPAALQTSKGFANYMKQEYEHMREAAKIARLMPE